MITKYSDFKLFNRVINSGDQELASSIKNKHLADFSLNLVKIIDFSTCKINTIHDRICFIGFGDVVRFKAKFGPSLLSLDSMSRSDRLIRFNRYKPTHVIVKHEHIHELLKVCSSGSCALKFSNITIVSKQPISDRETQLITHTLCSGRNSTIGNVVTG